METTETIQAVLEKAFPEWEFTIGKRLRGACIIAKKSKYSGAEIHVSASGIIIEAAIPHMKTRMLLGAGAVLLKYLYPRYNEPALRIKVYLSNRYPHVKWVQ